MDTCFFCGAVELSEAGGYEKLSATVPSSQKPVSLVLTHLANCIQRPLDLKPSARLCPRCFQRLSEYDTIMVNLMTTQKRLTNQLRGALMSGFEVKEVEIPPSDVELVKDQDQDFDAEENPIICSICNVSFKHHTKIHEENRPRHYCSLCPKSFTERFTLKMHMKYTHGSSE